MTHNANTSVKDYKHEIKLLFSRKHDVEKAHNIDSQIDYILEDLPNTPDDSLEYNKFRAVFNRTYRLALEQYKKLIEGNSHLSFEEKYNYLNNMCFIVDSEREYPLFVELYKDKLHRAVREELQENGKKKTTDDFKIFITSDLFLKAIPKKITGATIGTEIYNENNALEIEKKVIEKFANEYLENIADEDFENNLFSEDSVLAKTLKSNQDIINKLLETYAGNPNALRRWSTILGPNGENNRVSERDVQVAINSLINEQIIKNYLDEKLKEDLELQSLVSEEMKDKILEKANSDLVFYSPLDTSKLRAFSKLVADKAIKEADKQFSLVKKASEILKAEAADAGLSYDESTKSYSTINADGSKVELFTLDSIVDKSGIHETSFSNLRRDGSRGQDKTVSHANVLFTMENHLRSTIASAAKEQGVDLRELRLKNKIKTQLEAKNLKLNEYVDLDNLANQIYSSTTFGLDIRTALRDKKDGYFSETKAIDDAIGRIAQRKIDITNKVASKLSAHPYNYEGEELKVAVNRVYNKLDTEVVSKKDGEWFGPLHGYFGMKLAIEKPGIFSKVLNFFGFSTELSSRFSESRHIDNAINAFSDMKERRKENLTALAINNEINSRGIDLVDVTPEQMVRLKNAAKKCFEHVNEIKEIKGTLWFKDTRKQTELTFARNNLDEAYEGSREIDYYRTNLKLLNFQSVLNDVVNGVRIAKLEKQATNKADHTDSKLVTFAASSGVTNSSNTGTPRFGTEPHNQNGSSSDGDNDNNNNNNNNNKNSFRASKSKHL